MEQRKFFSDVAFTQITNLLIKAVWILVIDRAVQNILSDYGAYYKLLSLSILFLVFLDLGLNSLNTTKIAQDPSALKAHLGPFMKTKALLALGYMVVLWMSAQLLNLNTEQRWILVSVGGFQVINSFNQLLRSNIAAYHRFKLDAVLAVLDRVLVILILGTLLYVPSFQGHLTIRNFVLAQIVGSATTFIVAFGLVFSLHRKIQQAVQNISIKEVLTSALPYALLATMMAIYTRVDAVMIGQLIGDIETDRYAMCYRLIDAGNMVAASLSAMLLPIFSKLITKREELTRMTQLSSRLLLVPVALFVVLALPHVKWLLEGMYPDKLGLQSPETFALLLLSFIASSSIYIYGTLLTAAAKLKSLNTLAVTASVLNIVLNFILIPKQGIEGAALATMATQLLFAAGCFWKGRLLMVQTNPLRGRTGKAILFLAVFTPMYMWSKEILTNDLQHIMAGIGVALIGLNVIGFVRKSDIQELLRRKT